MFDTIVNFVTLYYIPIMLWYLAGGVVYAVAKWVFLLTKLRSKVLAITSSDLERYRAGAPAYKDHSDEFVRDKLRSNIANSIFDSSYYPPLVSHNKGNLMMWAVFWPINLAYTMFADVAREFFSFIYRKFGDMLQALSNSILPK